jgi:hypothetical protein
VERVLRSLTVCGFLVSATLATRVVGSPQPATADPLQPLAFLFGRREGTSNGQPGTAGVQREYTRILNSQFARTPRACSMISWRLAFWNRLDRAYDAKAIRHVSELVRF